MNLLNNSVTATSILISYHISNIIIQCSFPLPIHYKNNELLFIENGFSCSLYGQETRLDVKVNGVFTLEYH